MIPDKKCVTSANFLPTCDMCVLGNEGDPGYIPGPHGPPGKKGFPGRPGAAKVCHTIVHNNNNNEPC